MPSEVPDGWTSVPLAKAGTWLSGGTPRRTNESYWGGDIPWISAKSIHDFYLSDSEDRVTHEGAQNGTKLVPPGTVLMVVRGMSLANDFRVGIAQKPLTFNQDLKAILPDNDRLDPMYLGLFLQGSENEVLGMVSTASHGTCKLDTGRLGALPVLLPPLPEQKKIATILSSVDEAIQATQAVIEQTRRVKEGLLQDLLTRGIARSPTTDTIHGPMPASWVLVPAETVCSVITKGTTPPRETMSRQGQIPYLRVGNLTFTGSLDLTDLLFVEASTHTGFLKRSILSPGDVLTNIVGPPLGQVALVTDQFAEWNMNQAIAVFRPKTEQVLPHYLMAVLQWRGVQQWLLARAKQTSGQVNLTLRLCRNVPIPLPDIDEQAAIVERLASADTSIQDGLASLAKLTDTKAGLLQDLLTGKVRVSV